MTIKKVYVELITFLEANKGKKIEGLMPKILEMTSSKQQQKCFVTDDEGNVTHIFCYYHKKWEPIAQCEYGTKKHSPSGYNSMCKEGVNAWTKQQRVARQADSDLLMQVMNQTLSPNDIESERVKISEQKDAIIPRKDGIGTDEI